MPATYRDSIQAANSGSSITVDPSTLSYQNGDVLVLHVFGYTSLAAPSGSDVTWSEELSDTQAGPFSNTDIHKVWVGVADAAITSFTIAHGLAAEYRWFLTSISGADTSTPVDAKAIDSNIFSVVGDPTAPSISPPGSDSLLLSACGTWVGNADSTTFTAPSGMTLREQVEQDFDASALATLGLSASGATGTKAFAESPASSAPTEAWIASNIAIKSAAAGGATAAPDVGALALGSVAAIIGKAILMPDEV